MIGPRNSLCYRTHWTHCFPCNTFGEQREIYEWIGLFLSPPENKICLLHSKTECPIHSKTAFFNRPIQGGLAHQKCYARVQPGHSVRRKSVVTQSSSLLVVFVSLVASGSPAPLQYWAGRFLGQFLNCSISSLIYLCLCPPVDEEGSLDYPQI